MGEIDGPRELSAVEIEGLLKQGRCRESSQGLIDLALARGARDNVTVIVVHADRDQSLDPRDRNEK